MFKKISLLTTIFISTTFSQDQYCYEECSQEIRPLIAAYNAPSGIVVQGCWDLLLKASFIYWMPYQEHLEIGFISSEFTPTLVDADFANANFTYKPGFRVGIGYKIDRDNWDTSLDYTWFRSSQNTSVSLNPEGTKLLFPVFIFPDVTASSYLQGSQDWQLHMDLLDWALAREYFVGTSLTFHPFLGVRAAWIRQNLKNGYFDESTGFLAFRNVISNQSSNSWGIGPRLGIQSDFLLGQNIRFYGIGAGDILFTQYTHINYSQIATNDSGTDTELNTYRIRQNDLNYLRPHIDLELGFRWGTSFACEKRYVDLSLGYCFQVFFNQNMFRHFTSELVLAKSVCPNGNLYIHGLNINVRFDF